MTPAEDYADRYPTSLGRRETASRLGRALLMNPDIILADEAISALDVSLRVEMMDLILDLQETFDTSYVFISHDLANARYLAKRAGGRIAIMYLGNIVEIGGPDEVIQNPSHPYTEVLRWSTPSMDPDVAMERIKEKPPVRQIDVPDPQDPPSGCAFHPRCTKAREVCAAEDPELYDAEDTEAAWFPGPDNHEYWSSPELEDAEGSGTAELGGATEHGAPTARLVSTRTPPPACVDRGRATLIFPPRHQGTHDTADAVRADERHLRGRPSAAPARRRWR